MDVIFVPLLNVLSMGLSLYWWAVIIYVIMSWLEQFDIINRYNPVVYNISSFLFRIVEPPLEKIRRFVPPISAIDISPIILILAIFFLQQILVMLTGKFI